MLHKLLTFCVYVVPSQIPFAFLFLLRLMGQCCTSSSTIQLTSTATGMSATFSDVDTQVDNTGIGSVIVSAEELSRIINQKSSNLRILDVTIGGAKAFTR